jgi:Fungal specific transcription factor domain
LNRNCDEWNIPDDVKEERKRVFWCCFVIDRITSATYGRTFTIDEADCDISLPDVPDTPAGPMNGFAVIDQFRHLIQIIKILGYIIQNTYYVKARESAFSQNMNGIITTLENKLSTWLASLPPELQSQSNHTTGISASVAKCQLHMFYHAAVVLLYRPMIPAAKQSQDSRQSPSWVRCSTAANAIVDIAQGMFETGKLRYVHNYLIYAIFTGAIIFVHNASSAMDREIVQDSKNRIHMIMKFFTVIERTWNTAARSSSILGGLLGVRDIDLEQRPPQYKAEDLTSQDESFALKSGPSTSFERHRGSPQQWLQKRQASNGGRENDLKGSGVEQMQGSTETYGAKHASDVSQRSAPQGHVYDHPVEPSAAGYSFSPAQSQMGLGQSMDAGTSTMDPFAAPGTVLGPSHTNYDPLATAFWGVPSSLDIEEWNNYLGSQGMQQQQQQPPPSQQQQGNPDSQMQMYRQSNNNSTPPMVPGSHPSTLPHMQPKPSPGVENMTVPSKLPSVPANSSLFNYYNNDLSKSPGYQRQDNNTNTSNMMYW